ncbi:hypothetical protein [Colwellia sp. MT41]|nr:hypothetical protein [Colwellia sp. MT41]
MNASIRQFNALLIKEFKEAYRDKRALMVALFVHECIIFKLIGSDEGVSA